MALTDFANIVADAEQEDNIAGNQSYILATLAKNFSAEWPTKADVVAGEITGDPTARLGAKKFAKITVPANTVKYTAVKSETAGHQGKTHSIEFQLAGTSKAVQAELEKFQNAGGVFIVPGNDGGMYVVGSSVAPIYLGYNQQSGGNGTEQRGTTLTGSRAGQKHACLPLSTATAALIPVL